MAAGSLAAGDMANPSADVQLLLRALVSQVKHVTGRSELTDQAALNLAMGINPEHPSRSPYMNQGPNA